MNIKFFNIYQYVAFFILFPISIIIWNMAFNDVKLISLIIGLPVLVAYIIPFIGTNITKFWEFNTKYKVKNIRLYHGFVFGSATSIIGYLFYLISPEYKGILESLIFAFVCGSFIAFWNTIYDYKAVKCDFIRINSKTSQKSTSALEIVFDYAPSYFYTFGFVYALFLKVVEFLKLYPQANFSIALIILFYILALTLPTLVYMCFHYVKFGTFVYWIQKHQQ